MPSPAKPPAQGQILGSCRASSALIPLTQHPWAVFCLASVLTSEPCLEVNKLQGNQLHSPHPRLLLGRFHRGKWLLPVPLCTSRHVQLQRATAPGCAVPEKSSPVLSSSAQTPDTPLWAPSPPGRATRATTALLVPSWIPTQIHPLRFCITQEHSGTISCVELVL